MTEDFSQVETWILTKFSRPFSQIANLTFSSLCAFNQNTECQTFTCRQSKCHRNSSDITEILQLPQPNSGKKNNLSKGTTINCTEIFFFIIIYLKVKWNIKFKHIYEWLPAALTCGHAVRKMQSVDDWCPLNTHSQLQRSSLNEASGGLLVVKAMIYVSVEYLCCNNDHIKWKGC